MGQAPRKKAHSARLLGWPYAGSGPTRAARFAQQRLLSPWGSCFVTARGRYHLFPGDGRSGAGLGERPGFCVAFLALVETPAEGGRRLGAKRPERAGPGAKDPGPRSFVWQAVGPSAPRPPNAAAPRTALPAGRRGRRRFYGRADGPGHKNMPAAGRSPAAGGWAVPTRRRPPPPGFSPTPKGTTGQGQPKGYLWYGSPALILQAR